ncbi:MAG TPA: response regulator [Syntrophomonadaceae bacterium]|nr:response regulator [Syntrophomonadaceae bacterium]
MLWTLLLIAKPESNAVLDTFKYSGLFITFLFFLLAYHSYRLSKKEAAADKIIHYQAYLLETIPENVMLFDGSFRLIYLNRKAKGTAQFVLGETYSLSRLLDRIGFHDDFPSIKVLIDQGIPWQGEQRLVTDDSVKTFLHRLDHWSNGQEVQLYVLVSNDISDLVENRERVDIANLTKTQFLANMSHEMRTPMIGILGSINLLEQSDLTAEQINHVAIVRECGEHLLGVINEILDVSKLELGVDSFYPKPSNLEEICSQAIRLIEPLAREKGLSIGLDIEAASDCSIITDKIKLRQILLNLLHNAIKFTDRGGINLHARLESSEGMQTILQISVADTGVGIAPDKIPTIFQPFTQADSSFSRTVGGTGLGLYICRKLVELMEGEILLDTQEGQGSIFYIRIPVELASDALFTQEAEDVSIPPEIGAGSLLDFSPVRVLLVEDNRINHRIVAQMLNSYGFDVSTAIHGLDCLRIMQTQSFDIVLMDMQMPIMDGYEATQHICQDPDLSGTPVIAMTAHAMSGDREKCLQCGCIDYIAKPFRTEELVGIIQRNLKNPRAMTSRSDLLPELLLADLLPEFLDSLSDMIQDLHRSLDKKDAAAIQSISHDIKGSAGLYGLGRISDLAALIEQAAKENLIHKARILAVSLYSMYEELHQQVS